ncbi:hypothetical protein ACOSQ3_012031 [Xanthoceras sorbifolium]
MGRNLETDDLLRLVASCCYRQYESTFARSATYLAKDDTVAYINNEKPPIEMYGQLLNLASSALAETEFKREKSNFWEEPYRQASVLGETIVLLYSWFSSLGFYFCSPFANQTVYRSATYLAKDDTVAYINNEKPPIEMYGQLLNLASSALAETEFKGEKSNFWEEPYRQASVLGETIVLLYSWFCFIHDLIIYCLYFYC